MHEGTYWDIILHSRVFKLREVGVGDLYFFEAKNKYLFHINASEFPLAYYFMERSPVFFFMGTYPYKNSLKPVFNQ